MINIGSIDGLHVPGLETYAAVDTGLAMEKVWAERAGLTGAMIVRALETRSWQRDLARTGYPEAPLAEAIGRYEATLVAAGFTGGEAEELRRAMGFKRSEKRMKQIEVQLREGMARNGITGETAEHVMAEAREAGVHYIAGGHYATERFGIPPSKRATRRSSTSRFSSGVSSSGMPLRCADTKFHVGTAGFASYQPGEM